MRWRIIFIGVLSLLGATACPHSFGRGGTIDRAVHKDAKAVLQEEECTEEIRQKYCTDPDNMEQCPEECE
jgi:hypothetical protein